MTLPPRLLRIAIQLGLGLLLILGGWIAGSMVVRASGWATLVLALNGAVPVAIALGLIPAQMAKLAKWGVVALAILVGLSLISAGIGGMTGRSAPAAIWLWLFAIVSLAGVAAQVAVSFGMPDPSVSAWKRAVLSIGKDWRLPAILFAFAVLMPFLGSIVDAAGAMGTGIALISEALDPIIRSLRGLIRRNAAENAERDAEAAAVLSSLPGIDEVESCFLTETAERMDLDAALSLDVANWSDAFAVADAVENIMGEAGVEQTRLTLAHALPI